MHRESRRSRRGAIKVAAIVATVAILATACGDDDDDDTSADTGADTTAVSETTADDTTDTTAASETTVDDTTDTTEAPALELTEPVDFILLAEVPGESPVASAWAIDGFSMAMADLNAAGGIGGLEATFERISAPILDPAGAETALLRAIDADPVGIVGLASSGQSLATGDEIAAAEIPVLQQSTANQLLYGAPDSIANDWSFMVRPPQVAIASTMAVWALGDDGLALQRPALVCNNDAFGTNGCNAARAVAEDLGVEFAAEVTVESTTTDFTSQILEMQGADVDGIVGFIYPNAVPTMYDQLGDNGLDIPMLTGSTSLTWQGATRDDLSYLYGIDDCNPVADPRPEVQEWTARFIDEYGYDPVYQVASHYDSVFLFADAITRAGSTDHQAVRDALAETDYTGICGDYRGDPSQGLFHAQHIIGFSADGPMIVKDYPLEDFATFFE